MNKPHLFDIILISLIIIQVKFVPVSGTCLIAEDICPNQYVQFYLYKSNPSGSVSDGILLLNPLELDPNDFDLLSDIKILIHGYNGNQFISPNADVRPALLEHGPVNVISVDYGALAPYPCYPTAVANTPIIAKCLAQLINNLVSNITENEKIHLIGFSIGAQIAGVAANNVTTTLHRITGLDPAGPGFDIMPSGFGKLDSSDAIFVDVIHTDTMLFGTKNCCGHVDFYPNYPNYPQNGCPSAIEDDKCSHFRSCAYYAESLETTPSQFLAYPCGTTTVFLRGQCGIYASSPKVRMGGYVTPYNASGSYFLETNAESPYGDLIGASEPIRFEKRCRCYQCEIQTASTVNSTEPIQIPDETILWAEAPVTIDFADIGSLRKKKAMIIRNDALLY